jgi:hypothetical protein
MTSFVVGNDGVPRITKDPQARLDYKFDWSAWLGADTISNATFAVGAGSVSIDATSRDDTSATVWLTGGTHGESVLVTCHITTSVNRQDDRSFIVVVQNR